ncbi:MAG: DNA alkylation repair protein [Deltaproteobacteria bacterium]|nr:MAG: DNA alkylation repair protein [Deltaproteobacteria bacterium]
MQAATLVAEVRDALEARAEPANVAAMQAYLKTDMPFYGVKRPALRDVFRLARGHRPRSAAEYATGVRALWEQPHREEKYVALAWARTHKSFIGLDALPLYLDIVRDGAWWDLVDETAVHLVGEVWLREREAVSPQADAWISDEDLWVRRIAVIGQLRHKTDTDQVRLFAYCEARAHEKEFFMRKAIGWALRQYGRTEPDAVRAFVDRMGDRLSGLSRREALKHLG